MKSMVVLLLLVVVVVTCTSSDGTQQDASCDATEETCQEHHDDWKEQPGTEWQDLREQSRQLLSQIGWDEESWDYGIDSPESEIKRWEEFSELERDVYAQLGWDEDFWKSGAGDSECQTRLIFDDFQVAGVNLGRYQLENEPIPKDNENQEPFQLFADFDIGDKIQGNETYWDLVTNYKFKIESKSLSFYKDKVAIKRWLPTVGLSIPKLYGLKYASELTSSGNREQEVEAILNLLPREGDYVAKPSNKIRGIGVWIVSYDDEDPEWVRVSKNASVLAYRDDFDPKQVAVSLVNTIHEELPDYASPAAKKITPGIVVEERFTAFDNDDRPALEFKILTIWGRLFLAVWKRGARTGKWTPGVVDRDGNMVGCSSEQILPSWVNWTRVVEMTERLGSNKDMFRSDIFVGVPAGSPSLREGASEEERLAAVEYLVNEVEIFSYEAFPKQLMEECARLWIAGYKMGIYRVVPNTEVPEEFLLNE